MKQPKKNKDEEVKTSADVLQSLKDVNTRAAERKSERDVIRTAANEVRRKRMTSKPASKGSALQGLQATFGSKIVK